MEHEVHEKYGGPIMMMIEHVESCFLMRYTPRWRVLCYDYCMLLRNAWYDRPRTTERVKVPSHAMPL